MIKGGELAGVQAGVWAEAAAAITNARAIPQAARFNMA